MRIVRWLVFIPAGVIVAILVTFPVHWLVLLIGSFEGNPLNILSPRTLETLIIAFATPFSMVFGGSWMAPTHRFEAAIALSVFVALILGGVYVSAFSGNPMFSGWKSLYYGATPVLNLIGITSALYTASRKWKAGQVKSGAEAPEA